MRPIRRIGPGCVQRMPTKLYPLTDTHPRRPLHHTAPQPGRARRRVRSHADTPLLRRACGEEGEAEKTAGNHGHPFVPEALEPIRTPRFVPSFSSALRPPPSSTHLRTPIPRDPPPNRPTTRQGTAKEAESCRHPSSPKSMRRRGGNRENHGESRTPICSGGIGTNPDSKVCPLSFLRVATTALQRSPPQRKGDARRPLFALCGHPVFSRIPARLPRPF